jgi:hypothetical protein
MCKITKYRSACGHSSAHLLSRCGGTKHNHNKEGASPACKSGPWLEIQLPNNCGPCQRAVYEADLRANNPQGGDQLEKNLWDSRLLFAAYKWSTIERVELGRFEKKGSPLRHEVQPDETPVPPADVVSTGWNWRSAIESCTCGLGIFFDSCSWVFCCGKEPRG